MKKEGFDVIIIGTGPAGISAAIYTARAKLKTLLLGKPEDGALYKAKIIANYFGFAKEIGGKEIIERSMIQAQRFGTKFISGEVVNTLKEKKGFLIKMADGKQFLGKNLIIATGKAYKMLGAENEEALSGNGVHYCVTCDGYYYNKKKVAVIGHSNLAAEEALGLLRYTKDITIFSNGLKFDISPFLKKELKKDKIILREEKVKKFVGKKALEKLELEKGEQIKFDGVFMALGRISALNFATKLALKIKDNDIVINRDGITSVENVYAAGNCTGGNAQAANSVGEGCNAAMTIIKKQKGVATYIDYD